MSCDCASSQEVVVARLPAKLMDHGTEDEAGVHDRMLGCAPLRQALPGLENWLTNPREYFRGPWEGTVWALLSLGIWAEASGVR